MARGIMADKEDKSDAPTSDTNDNTKLTVSPINDTPCSCTKISIMQLFYEMKQKFPTVPDNVVCEFVGQNCHNRSACIDGLEDYPNSANVYPAALRNQPIKKKTHCNNRSDKQNSIKLMANLAKENENENHTNENGVQLKVSNTLNLTNLNCCTRPISRPTRVAPPPPSSSSSSSPQIKSSQPNQPLNLSVNVIVSPVTRPPKQQPLSHYSFTLHQPNSQMKNASNDLNQTENLPTTTTTANENNVPSLRYTSSAYDAGIGYQSRLEITVAGTKASNDTNNETIQENSNAGNNTISLKRSCEISPDNNLPSVVASSEFIEETETVHHQILCKQKLVLELEKDRKRLERMQRELRAIQAPIPDGGIVALNLEVEKLRNDCKQMAQHVEEAGPSYALGETNEAFYRNIYTGQQLPMQQRQQPLRPHRPAPSPIFARQNTSHANVTVDPRFISAPTITQSPLNPHLNGDAGWICDLCTFQNKYTEQTCEACTMPFLSAGNQMGYNNNGQFVQPTPPYPLTHYMPMPAHSLPYNNNNNMPYLIYYQPTAIASMPQYYPTQPLANPQSMHSRF